MLRRGAGLANPLLLGELRLAELAGVAGGELAESVATGFEVAGLVGPRLVVAGLVDCEPCAGA